MLHAAPLLQLAVLLAAGAPGPRAPTRAFETPAPPAAPTSPAETEAVRAPAPPVIDGVLDDDVWDLARPLGDFTGWQPVENAAALERTEVRVLYDERTLYFAIRAVESDPGRIRAQVAARDRADDGDFIGLYLDPFGNAQSAYAFVVNPLGGKVDGIVTRALLIPDRTWDAVWRSAGRLDASGYTIEVEIPLSSLRYPGGSPQTWALQVVRRYAARGAVEAWAPMTAASNSQLSQMGRLTGLEGLESRRVVELQPALVASRLRTPADPGFHQDDAVDLGVTAKLGLTSGLVLDLTANPDFSQVEADPSLITVNQRYAVTLPETRPFFLDRADLFATSFPILYTRRIASPVFGARVAGTAAGVGVGLLAVRDRGPAPPPGGARPDETDVVALRLRRELSGGSSLGAISTYRDGPDGRNVVGGADWVLRFGGLYDVSGQVLVSDTRDGTLDATGLAYRVALGRSGRRLGVSIDYTDVAPEFRAEAGLINDALQQRHNRPDLRMLSSFVRYRVEREDRALRSVTANVITQQFFLHDWTRTEGVINPGIFFNFNGHTSVGLWSAVNYERWQEREFTTWRLSPNFHSARFGWIEGHMFLHAQEALLRSDSPFVGWQWMPSGGFTIRAGDALELGVGATHVRFLERFGGPLVFTADAVNGSANYQFSSALGLRGELRWSSVEFEDSPATRRLGTSLLLSYTPAAGTVLYAGYNQGYLDDGALGAGALEPMDRSLFLKAAYTWRPGAR